AISRFILGVQPDYDGLIIDPCIPGEWESYSVERKFRGARYRIAINNPEHLEKGEVVLTIDGQALEGNKIPVMAANNTYQIIATITK
ncbi:MAG: glycosyl transferase, partial [FCB group bacterium]|nr:glycosyl transferase [FCB group bacterium]